MFSLKQEKENENSNVFLSPNKGSGGDQPVPGDVEQIKLNGAAETSAVHRPRLRPGGQAEAHTPEGLRIWRNVVSCGVWPRRERMLTHQGFSRAGYRKAERMEPGDTAPCSQRTL